MDALQKPFVWKTQDGLILRARDMRTTHLFYSIRMIWNHSVPAAYRIPGCKQYRWPLEIWTKQATRDAMAGLMSELATRDDLPVWMLAQLWTMHENCKAAADFQLPAPTQMVLTA